MVGLFLVVAASVDTDYAAQTDLESTTLLPQSPCVGVTHVTLAAAGSSDGVTLGVLSPLLPWVRRHHSTFCASCFDVLGVLFPMLWGMELRTLHVTTRLSAIKLQPESFHF